MKLRSIVFASTISTLALSTGVMAAEVAQPKSATPAADSGTGLEDIIVTARRRQESLQSVPQTISVISPTKLLQSGVAQVSDLAQVTPGVNIGGQRRNDGSFYIRGQGPGPAGLGVRNFSSVATYFAEVPVSLPGSGVFFDLTNVQILKGPQGTLFGRNTTGGAVLIEPARPTETIEGYGQIDVGNYKYRQFEGMVNLPIVPDRVILRVAGQISRRQGYTKSVVTGQWLDGRDYEAMRGSLLLKPSDGIENLTIVDYRSQDNSGQSEVLDTVYPGSVLSSISTPAALAPALGLPAGTVASIPARVGGVVSTGCLTAALPGCPAGGAVGAFIAAFNHGNTSDPANSGFYLVAPTATLQAALANQKALGPRRNSAPQLSRYNREDLGITNKTTVELNDNLKLKNIFGLRTYKTNESLDFDGTPLNLQQQLYSTNQAWQMGYDQLSDELQVQGNLPAQNISYIAGAYFEKTTPAVDPQIVTGVTLGRPALRQYTSKDTSRALFGHVEWNPFSFAGISAGIRQTWDRRALGLTQLDPTTFACVQTDLATNTIVCPIAYKARFKGTSYDVTVNTKPWKGTLVFASLRHGYKSGGFNLPAPLAPGPNPLLFQTFKPEHVDSYEIGMKSDWNIGVPIRTNLSLFYDRYNDIQITQSIVLPPPVNIAAIIQNVGRQVNKGAEFEATVQPAHFITLSGFSSYLDATSSVNVLGPPTASYPGGTPAVVKGRQAAYSPKWTYGVSTAITLPVPESYGSLVVSADYSWRSKVTQPDVNALPNERPGYGLVNGRVAWNNFLGKGVDLAVFGTNLTNKTYVLAGYPILQLGFQSVAYGEPRMYGMSAKIHF